MHASDAKYDSYYYYYYFHKQNCLTVDYYAMREQGSGTADVASTQLGDILGDWFQE